MTDEQPIAEPPEKIPRLGRWRAVIEFGLVAVIFAADWLHLVPFSKTPFLLAIAWWSLWSRGLGWRSVGMRTYRDWGRTVAAGILAGTLIEVLELFVVGPIGSRITGRPPDLSDFAALHGNRKLLLIYLALTWTLAAFGEEMVYRGWLMSRAAEVGGGMRRSWVAALIAVNVVFGLAHTYQGPTGVMEAAVDGVLYGILYLRCDRSLLVPVLAHGVQDTIDVLLLFLGWYPGI